MYYYILGIIGFVCCLIIKSYLKKSNNKVNIDPEEEIKIYGVSKADFSNIKTYDYEDIPMFRDLPLKDDYYMAYYISNQYGLNKNNLYIINVIILKWIKDGIVSLVDMDNIKLNKEPIDKIELELFKMMKKNSKDDILNKEDFKWFCKENYERFNNWLANSLIMKNSEILNNREYIDIEWVKDNHIDGHYEFRATDKLNGLALQLAGLKKFFHHMTLMGEKEAIEVHLWRDYLIYAEIFGVAYKVADSFKDLYDIDINDFVDVSLVDSFIDYTIVTTMKAIETANAIDNATSSIYVDSSKTNDFSNIDKAIDYSSGGEGFSSGGGGSGSFGGGDGGGGTR